MEYLLRWVQLIHASYPLAAPLVFIGVHALLAVFFLPCSPMTLLAGALWGGAYGLGLSMAGAVVSSATTFILARGFLHARIERLLAQRFPKLGWLMAQATVHDWKLIAVMQVNPLIPASSLGYVFGLSRVSFVRYVLFSAVFMLPLQILFVMSGQSIARLIQTRESLGWVLALLTLLVVLPFISKSIFRKLSKYLGIRDGT